VVVAAAVVASPHPVGGMVTVNPSPTPAFGGDAADPNVVFDGSTYYAFTTGTPLGNHLQVLIDTTGDPRTGWRSYTGNPYGSTALPSPPSWQQINTQTSPGVFFWGGRWVMYYDAALAPHAGDTGFDCLSVATAATLTPAHPVFTDTSSGPFYCQPTLGGSIDPSPFVDPATGKAYLVWKSNDGGSVQPARIWSAQLSADGMSFVGQPSEILFNDTVNHPWETTVENPAMVNAGGVYYLLFSGGQYNSSGYAEGYAVCSGPLGPCQQPQPGPILTSYGGAAGPGGGSLFKDGAGNWWIGYAAWSPGCTDYSCGGSRKLYVAPANLPGPPSGKGAGYWMLGSVGTVYAFGNAPWPGSPILPGGTSATHIEPTHDNQGYWVVNNRGNVYTFGDAAYFGGAPPLGPFEIVSSLSATASGHGYWLFTNFGRVFAYGDATFRGDMTGVHLNGPVLDSVRTPSGNGYYLVASDGGIFTFGDAAFKGSMGGQHLNGPVVGLAPDAASGGYWLVASDGGIFAFGGAAFRGSMGGQHLNRGVIGMVGYGDGYLMVASDGGIFDFSNTAFVGSLGATPPSNPIVSVAALNA